MRLFRRKPDYTHIAEMERELASLPVPTLDEQIQEAHDKKLAARRRPDRVSSSGVLLGRNVRPLVALSSASDLELVTGRKWLVDEHDSVRSFVAMSSYPASATTVALYRKPLVHLPPGVTAS